ncbi:MAG: magnesium transporter [Thermodesulfobacteriota bacterium]|nr:magnesium transporter [Thermodesulfobacteriota bacterium]
MFKTVTIDEIFIENVKHHIDLENHQTLSKLLSAILPVDIADLIKHLNPDERLFVFNILEPEVAGEVLVEIEPSVQEYLLENVDNKAITEIIQELDSDDATDLVSNLPDDRAKEIIETIGEEVSEELEKLLPYPKDTAGGIMALEFMAVKASDKILDAIEIIRKKKKEVEQLYYLWVIDDYERLVGTISLQDLILESPEQKISNIMNPEVISVPLCSDQEEVIHLVKKYDLLHIPVVDEHHRLVGYITHDDIIDVMKEEVDEDISRMGGIIYQDISEESPLRISRARLPWLIIGLFGGLCAAFVINQFESSLEKMIALSFFFPAIMAIGGNTGIQASTIVVRGLATGDISLMNIGKRLLTEMSTALINGIICGSLLGIIVGVWLANYGLGAMVALSLLLIILFAGFIGAATPLALRKLNIDPALATGPFVTTSNDILSLFIYLGIVTIFLRITV